MSKIVLLIVACMVLTFNTACGNVAAPRAAICDSLTTNQVKLVGPYGEIKAGGKLNITADAVFPTLTAAFCGTAAISFTFTIDPLAGIDYVCKKTTYTSKLATWVISDNYSGTKIQGGTATLSWTGTVAGSIKFTIVGTQPAKSTLISQITSRTKLWYAQYVAMHESGGGRQFDKSGYPLRSSDNGYGIFQLTLGHISPDVTCAQLWSWKENVNRGCTELESKQTIANDWMKSQRSQASNKPVPRKVEGNCVFEDGTARTIEHAVGLKAYNGASCGHYCAWDNSNSNAAVHAWKFNLLNSYGTPCGGFNYVNRVCTDSYGWS